MHGQPGANLPFLTKYQKNDLFRAIQKANVLPMAEFDVRETERNARPVAIIRHLPTDSYFTIERDADNYRINTNPILKEPVARVPWQSLEILAQAWAEEIGAVLALRDKYEKTPDLWKMLRQGKDFLFSREDTDNTPFTDSEQHQISGQLTQVEEYIKATHQLTAAQLTRLENTIHHVEEASRRIGRKDWILLFNGAVFSLILTDLVTPQTAQHVLLITVHALGQLFGHGMPPLPPP
jgi:hypothetical protein